jgi:hypothetical protein
LPLRGEAAPESVKQLHLSRIANRGPRWVESGMQPQADNARQGRDIGQGKVADPAALNPPDPTAGRAK